MSEDDEEVKEADVIWAEDQDPYTLLLPTKDGFPATLACAVARTQDGQGQKASCWVAVPESAWGRRWDTRPFQKDDVLRAVSLEIACTSQASDEGQDVKSILVELSWDGTSFGAFEMYTEDLEAPPHNFGVADGGELFLPSSAVLIEALVAAKQTKAAPPKPRARPREKATAKVDGDGYTTALDGDQPATAPAGKAGPPKAVSTSVRMGALESSVSNINGRLDQIFELLNPEPKLPPPPKAKKSPQVPDELAGLALNPEQEAAIAKMIAKAGSKGKKEPDIEKLPPPKVKVTELGETDSDDGDASEADQDGGGGKGVEKAVVLLTQLLAKKSEDINSLEGIYAGQSALSLGSTGSGSALQSTGKGNGLLAMRKLICTRPEIFETMVLGHMKRGCRGTAELTSQGDPDALFFVEHRSMINDHVATATWSWLIATVINLLGCKPPKISEARARLLMGLAAAEQVSIDAGSWMYASDLLLLDQPVPFPTLSGHSTYGLKEPSTTLIDPQLFDMVTSRISSVEAVIERKKKLAPNRSEKQQESVRVKVNGKWKSVPAKPPPPKEE